VIGHLAAFLGVSILVIVTPGQDTALTIRNSLAGGRRGGVFTAFGVATGNSVWALSASVGLAALLAASRPAFDAVRFAGAAFLVYLGAQALVAAFRRTGGGGAPASRRLSGRAALRQGLLSNLGNPKVAVFFTSLLPQFAASFPALFLLGLVFSSMTLAWLTCYAIAVAKAGNVLRRPAIGRILDAVTGVALVALGLRLATERR
jgi:threonine/homoserine/homoserine lactone efflux protein